MKQLNNYIIEKLHLNKDIVVKKNNGIDYDELIDFLTKYIFNAIQTYNIGNVNSVKEMLNTDSKYIILATDIHKKIWGADESRFSFIEYLSRNEIEDLMLQHTNNYYLGGGIYFWYDKKDGEHYSITINDSDFNDFDSGFGDPIIIKKI